MRKKDASAAQPSGTRTDRKRNAVLDAACELFLQGGFGATSMDDVARTAEVSKQTVYKQFTDKQTLFATVMQRVVEPMHTALRELVDKSTRSGSVKSQLTRYATALLEEVTRPDVIRLRHVIAAEAERFPPIAASWHRDGPARNVAALADRFAELTAEGRLDCADPVVAAAHFNWMLLGGPLMESLFTLERPAVTRTRRSTTKHVDDAVGAFLRAYPALD